MSEQDFNTSSDPFLKKVWNIFFILLYPVLITFSLIFTGVLLFFSGISKVLFKIIHFFSPKPEAGKHLPEAESTAINSPVANS